METIEEKKLKVSNKMKSLSGNVRVEMKEKHAQFGAKINGKLITPFVSVH